VSSRRIIVDTGPLVALLVKEETHHSWVKEQLRQLPAPFLTCEPVLTETFFLVRNFHQGTTKFFSLLNSGLLRVDFSAMNEATSLETLIQKYADVPMSLADACLVRIAELNADAAIFTLDYDFKIYRKQGRHVIPAIIPAAEG